MKKEVNSMGVNKMLGKSVFLKTFGESPINKILDFLVVFDNFDYSIADISDKANVGYSTLKVLIKDLVKMKIVVQTRESGNAKMYRLNKENLVVKRFVDFYWDITNQKVRELTEPIPA